MCQQEKGELIQFGEKLESGRRRWLKKHSRSRLIQLLKPHKFQGEKEKTEEKNEQGKISSIQIAEDVAFNPLNESATSVFWPQ